MAKRLGEFDRIERYFRPLATDQNVAFNLLDDAAVLTPEPGREIVISTDTLVEGVHFLPNTDPFTLAQKLLRVNLSDMAAMGATPRHYFLALTLPKQTQESWLNHFAAGLERDQTTFQIALAGGDTTQTDGPLVLTITMIGSVNQRQVLRRNAGQPGDLLMVSGKIGDGYLGLMAAQGGLNTLTEAAHHYLSKRYDVPNPRVSLGKALVAHGVRAGLDVSDGLVADIGHMARQSGLIAEIEVNAVPLSLPAREAIEGGYVTIDQLLTGGDDYELVFSVPADKVERLTAALKQDEFLPQITPIGQLVAPDAGAQMPSIPVRLQRGEGVAEWAHESGWQHR